jgi:hypothetical protein
MIPAMASPGQESEWLNSQFLVDSMPAMIHTPRPDGRGADGEYRWKRHCRVPLRDRRGNNFHVKELVDRFRANDRAQLLEAIS